MGVYTANESQAISRSRDKLRSLQMLSRTDGQMPRTGFAEETQDIVGVIYAVCGPPLVVKLLQGTQGVGVVRVSRNLLPDRLSMPSGSLKLTS